jgi:hypothetical protein
MSVVEFILSLACLALLVSYLWGKHRQRNRARGLPEESAGWTGRGFDAALIRPRLEQIRHNYTAQVHARPHEFLKRRSLVALARATLGRFAYFRHKNEDSEAARHPASAA